VEKQKTELVSCLLQKDTIQVALIMVTELDCFRAILPLSIELELR
jgi:hypothetical protein